MSVPWTCEACGGNYYGPSSEGEPHLCDCGREAAEAVKLLRGVLRHVRGGDWAEVEIDSEGIGEFLDRIDERARRRG